MNTIIIIYVLGMLMSAYLTTIVKKKGYEYGNVRTTLLSWFGFILVAHKFTKAEGARND